MVSKPFAVKAFLYLAAGVTVLLIAASLGHCTTTGRHENSLGVVMPIGNPNSYVAGAVKNVSFAGTPRNYGAAIRIQPMGTYSLYTEELFLCGDPTDQFVGKHNPMLMVYETVSHHTVEGIGCHELRGVHELKEERFQ